MGRPAIIWAPHGDSSCQSKPISPWHAMIHLGISGGTLDAGRTRHPPGDVVQLALCILIIYTCCKERNKKQLLHDPVWHGWAVSIKWGMTDKKCLSFGSYCPFRCNSSVRTMPVANNHDNNSKAMRVSGQQRLRKHCTMFLKLNTGNDHDSGQIV